MTAPFLLEKQYIRGLAPCRPDDGHKGTFGSVLLWVGSPMYMGAAHMCAMGAMRSGVGLVHLLTGGSQAPFFAAVSPSVITQILEENPSLDFFDGLLRRKDAVVVGPGLPPWEDVVKSFLPFVIEGAKSPILDAGALAFLAENPDEGLLSLVRRVEAGGLPAVLTPHPGEFSRLSADFDGENRAESAQAFACRYQCVVVLKGMNTVITSPDGKCAVNPTGNNGMAKGGSGDILAGILGGFLAQGLAPFEAACCAVYLHGLAGDMAAGDMGKRYMQPTDILGYLPEAYRVCGW